MRLSGDGMDPENMHSQDASEPTDNPTGSMPQLDDSQFPKPSFGERVREYREAITWRQVLAVTGAAAVAAGGTFLVWRRRRS